MNQTTRIQPRTLKGFRDMLPELQARKEAMLATARTVFQRYGFAPIDTPALEYAEILLAKAGGETQKQVYRFTDQGGRDVAMRFDLTVPLARFAAMHIRQLGVPFKRYHMGPVWRGENTARGRFREFWQCDFDIIGTRSWLADLEVGLVIQRLLSQLDAGAFTIHVSDRSILGGWARLQQIGERLPEILRAIDKLAKIGRERVTSELEAVGGLVPEQIDDVFRLIEMGGDVDAVLERLRADLSADAVAADGIDRLAFVFAGFRQAGIDASQLRLDLSITRGLDYYTGTIFETFLNDRPEFGSVCSGGRYDDLATLYSDDVLPGIGASLGLDRLLDAAGDAAVAGRSAARVLVVVFGSGDRLATLALAEELRAAGIPTELYLEDRKLPKQFQYADRRGIPLAVVAGPDELAAGTVQIKDLRRGEQHGPIPRAAMCERVATLLSDQDLHE